MKIMIVRQLGEKDSGEIRVRFAPSPTGEMHIGNMRTAIFNYLFAKSQGGKFLLRIEDTDFQRSKKIYEDSLRNKLKWMGLKHDEEIVYQSENLEEHRAVVRELFKNGHCYYCNCVAKSDDPDYTSHCSCDNKNFTSGAVRFKLNMDSEFQDSIMGNCLCKAKDMQDFIILRSDNTPTFNLSVVCDDKKMAITHVIRGNDHLSNTFKQVAIYKAMNWKLPFFAHLPLIVNEAGKKLSKRERDISIANYENMGILPEAILSFLIRLGWSYKNQEIFTMEELLILFPQGKFQKSSACFNESKLIFQNKHFINERSAQSLIGAINLLDDNKNENLLNPTELMLKGCDLLKSRCVNLRQLQENIKIFIPHQFILGECVIHWEPNSLQSLQCVLQYIRNIESFCIFSNYTELYNKINTFVQEKGFNPKDYQQILRYALTGEKVGANIMEIIMLLPREIVLERIERFLLLNKGIINN